MNVFPEMQPQTVPTNVAFRVECHSPGFQNNQTFGRGGTDNYSMGTYGTALLDGSWQQSFDAHLSWQHQATPFISFYSTIQRAMGRRRRMIQNGATDMVIIAVNLRGRKQIYDAHGIAQRLGYRYHSIDPRRRLEHHEGELLLHGSISADEYRIMGCFRGEGLQEVLMSHLWDPSILTAHHIEPPIYSTFLPADTVLPQPVDITDWIKSEIYSLTGTVNEFKMCMLVLALSGQNWQVVKQDGSVAVQTYSPYAHSVVFAN